MNISFKFFKFSISLIFLLLINCSLLFAEIINKIEINGNDRISNETIKLFANVDINDDLNKNDLNNILKNIYETNFFKKIDFLIKNNTLIIDVVENPIIENIKYTGIKKKSLIEEIQKNAVIKSRSSFNDYLLGVEKKRISNFLREMGYYNSNVSIYVENKSDNLVNLEINLDIGEKAKIKKISFVGNKIFKSSKLKRVIASSEYKFWKFLSGRKFLNENLVEFDKRLL